MPIFRSERSHVALKVSRAHWIVATLPGPYSPHLMVTSRHERLQMSRPVLLDSFLSYSMQNFPEQTLQAVVLIASTKENNWVGWCFPPS